MLNTPTLRRTGAVGLGLLLSACGSLPDKSGFQIIERNIEQRLQQRVHWNQGSEEDHQVEAAVTQLIGKPLTADSAVQIALLNNRRLQVLYEDVGVAQANLVQGGLLKNPIFGGTWLKPRDGDNTALDFDVRFDFLSLLTLPMRMKLAAAELKATEARVTGAVLDHAANTRRGFYEMLAAQHLHGMFEEIRDSAAAALAAAKKLRAAGNITAGALDRSRLSAAEAELNLASTAVSLAERREMLNRLMGLGPGQLGWITRAQLPRLPSTPVTLADLEQRALDASLDLSAAREAIEAAAKRAGQADLKSWVPDLELGWAWDREPSGEWRDGPLIELGLPLFDQGQGRRGIAAANLRRSRAEYVALGMEVQSLARSVARRIEASRRHVEHLIDALLPLNRSLSRWSLLEYNAMQIDLFRLLAMHDKEIAVRQRFVAALRDYWLARSDLDTLLSGRAVDMAGADAPAIASGGGDDGGH